MSKCAYGKRGRPSIEFYKDGKPQYYCRGWIDSMTGEALDVCQKCADYADGEQCEKDFYEHWQEEHSE